MAEPSLEDIVSLCGLTRERLQKECSQDMILKIAAKLADWKMVGHYLNIPSEKLKAIERENDTEDQRKVAMLETWQKREGKAASYWRLADALGQRGRRDLVESLCRGIAAQPVISKRLPPTEMSKKVSIGSASTMDIDRWNPESSKL